MEEDLILDDFTEDGDINIPGISEKDALLTIWTRPRDTFRFLFAVNPTKYVMVLMAIGGILGFAQSYDRFNNFIELNLFYTLAIVIVGGAIYGIAVTYLYTWLMSIVGKWMNGTGDPLKFRMVSAWASVPSIGNLILLIPSLYIFRQEANLAISNFSDSYFDSGNIYLIAIGLFSFILKTWSAVIAIGGIAELQGFGYGKAILNAILPVLIIIIPFALLFVINISHL